MTRTQLKKLAHRSLESAFILIADAEATEGPARAQALVSVANECRMQIEAGLYDPEPKETP